MPDNATTSLVTSSEKRLTSKHHESFGTARNALNGPFDSSLIEAEYSETANVRAIRNINENQKYRAWATDVIGLNRNGFT